MTEGVGYCPAKVKKEERFVPRRDKSGGRTNKGGGEETRFASLVHQTDG